MKKFLQEFKDFAVKGNMIDMAVGIIIGGGFGKLVTSLVNDILMPPIGMLLGNVNFSDLKIILKDAYIDAAGIAQPAVSVNYGNFIQVILDFIIVAFCIFLVVRLMNKLRTMNKKEEEVAAPAPEPTPTKEEVLLTEIRDLLKENKNNL
ncbi:large-conductance mechanosensitive channel protein MscL [Bacteroidales bacterium OttesenSCG-928-C03]|nr:large-conductance mechanosensitive channel protein MscL [Bacteroidales bacterium OttesenSCG-928-E04]MDL2308680.1 large-conductance mechanosensitive channel protein MscL [Bacteroidales bacterium OttesenSCG-928-C03]MDL2325952.1 large-conductance mechanosensitive channel protein MscL [Bacteroidales bacterium OttesenSCG-928-A14]